MVYYVAGPVAAHAVTSKIMASSLGQILEALGALNPGFPFGSLWKISGGPSIRKPFENHGEGLANSGVLLSVFLAYWKPERDQAVRYRRGRPLLSITAKAA